jgi:hypothetical protein
MTPDKALKRLRNVLSGLQRRELSQQDIKVIVQSIQVCVVCLEMLFGIKPEKRRSA